MGACRQPASSAINGMIYITSDHDRKGLQQLILVSFKEKDIMRFLRPSEFPNTSRQ
jgi:hypothetical protein